MCKAEVESLRDSSRRESLQGQHKSLWLVKGNKLSSVSCLLKSKMRDAKLDGAAILKLQTKPAKPP
jgi:hypothetical protein